MQQPQQQHKGKNFVTGFLIKNHPKNFSKYYENNLRKRAQNFQVLEGQFHYKCKNEDVFIAICIVRYKTQV